MSRHAIDRSQPDCGEARAATVSDKDLIMKILVLDMESWMPEIWQLTVLAF